METREAGSLSGVRERVEELIKDFSASEKRRIRLAMRYAEKLHRGQKRADDTPYILHVFRVVENLIVRIGVRDADLICAAFCHDLIEDQSMRVAENAEEYGDLFSHEAAIVLIREKFGTRVERVVEGLTHLDPGNGETLDEKRALYLKKVAGAIENPDVFYVKLADFYDNAFSLEKVINPHKRLHRAKKYLPVFGVFINRLERDDISLPQDKKNEIKAHLEEGAKRVSEIIRDTEASLNEPA